MLLVHTHAHLRIVCVTPSGQVQAERPLGMGTLCFGLKILGFYKLIPTYYHLSEVDPCTLNKYYSPPALLFRSASSSPRYDTISKFVILVVSRVMCDCCGA